jgi:hypothetical protein
VTIYHLILEATLGLTSFRFVTGYLEREGLRELLPSVAESLTPPDQESETSGAAAQP